MLWDVASHTIEQGFVEKLAGSNHLSLLLCAFTHKIVSFHILAFISFLGIFISWQHVAAVMSQI